LSPQEKDEIIQFQIRYLMKAPTLRDQSEGAESESATRVQYLDNLASLPLDQLGAYGISAIIASIDNTEFAEVQFAAIKAAVALSSHFTPAYMENMIEKLLNVLEYYDAPLKVAAAMALGSLGSAAEKYLPEMKRIQGNIYPNTEDASALPELANAIGRIEEGSTISPNDVHIVSRDPKVAEQLYRKWDSKYKQIAVPGADVLIKQVGTDSFFPGKLERVDEKTENYGGKVFRKPTFVVKSNGQLLKSRPFDAYDPNQQYEMWVIHDVKDIRESKTMWVKVNDPAVSAAAEESGTPIAALMKIEGNIATVRIKNRIYEVPVSSLTASRRVPSWGEQFAKTNSPLSRGNVVTCEGEPGLYVVEGFEDEKAKIRPLDAKAGRGHLLVEPAKLKYVGSYTIGGISTEPDVRSPHLRKAPQKPAPKPQVQPPQQQAPKPPQAAPKPLEM
jgi:hypothetical protein